MTLTNKELGRQGESLAALFLQKKGLRILARNFRTRSGEIDLVARDRKELVFVEVKTRSSSAFGSGLEAVGPQKCRQIVRVAKEYLLSNGGFDQAIRFDVVGVTMADTISFEHIKNAFDAG